MDTLTLTTIQAYCLLPINTSTQVLTWKSYLPARPLNFNFHLSKFNFCFPQAIRHRFRPALLTVHRFGSLLEESLHVKFEGWGYFFKRDLFPKGVGRVAYIHYLMVLPGLYSVFYSTSSQTDKSTWNMLLKSHHTLKAANLSIVVVHCESITCLP